MEYLRFGNSNLKVDYTTYWHNKTTASYRCCGCFVAKVTEEEMQALEKFYLPHELAGYS